MSFTASNNLLALVDCNSFFASCEKVFRPELKNKPVIVLSSNDGCVVSRTKEAKLAGIKAGMPYFKIKNFIKGNDVHVFSSNYALYSDMSNRVMKTLSFFSPEMEIYSVDEAFLSLNGFIDPKAHAEDIRDTVLRNTGIPVSVGIGVTKVLAKMANEIAKNKKELKSICRIDPDNLPEDFSAEDLWGIGKKSFDKLRTHGIMTAKKFQKANPELIERLLGLPGKKIQLELQGISCMETDQAEDKQEQILYSRSFGSPLFEKEDLRQALANFVTGATSKLREQKSLCHSLQVFLMTDRFKDDHYYNIANTHLSVPTSVPQELISHSFSCLDRIFKRGLAYKKTGVLLSHLVPEEEAQISLFESPLKVKNEILAKTMDAINQKHGFGMLKSGACGTKESWRPASTMKSREFTTCWNELLTV